ncbi:MAG: hypothetical protein JWO36_1741 [Myxococcales bacterium]|nr:hypothetical protein [Myxococcales bacterium]
MSRWLFLLLLAACSTKQDPPRKNPPKARTVSADNVAVPAGWFSAGCYRVIGLDLPSTNKEGDAFGEHMRMESCAREPPRRLWISSFEIARYEVTNEQYEQCRAAGGCVERASDVSSLWIKPVGEDVSQFPVFVTFKAAEAYCAWRGMRLPTQGEWEKAARGTDDRIFAWGDARPSCSRVQRVDDSLHAIPLGCENKPLREIGQLVEGASAYGLQDMEDNAPEWTTDWYNPVPRRTQSLRFTRENQGDYVILDLDWASVKYAWGNPNVVDPQGEPPMARMPGYRSSAHVAKGGFHQPGISGTFIGEFEIIHSDEDQDPVAGFRCVRSISGPKPPAIGSPPAATFVSPPQEPGYVPPHGKPGN